MTPHLQQLLARFDPELPLERAKTIPAAWYADPEMFHAERAHVFGRSWLIVGRTEQVQRPGAYLTAEVAGEPILVLRGPDRELRAFFNVCRHRAAPLLTEPCGIASKLRCRYHGWTYDLIGRLIGTPELGKIEDFDPARNGLAPMVVDTWGPFVAVCPGNPPCSLKQYLDPLTERASASVASLKYHARRDYELACNWKVFVDNYLDGGYHINTVHPALAGMIDYSRYRTDLHPWASVQSSPLTTPAGSLRPGGEAQYWHVFPNFMLNLYGGLMDTNAVLPLGPNRCRVVFEFYFADEGPPADAAYRAESIAVADRVQAEDAGICEEVQRGLGSRAFDTGRFSARREAAGYEFHRTLARCLSGAAIVS